MQSGWAYDAEPPAPLRPATQDEQNAVYRFSGGIGGVYTPLGGGPRANSKQTLSVVCPIRSMSRPPSAPHPYKRKVK